MKISVIGSGGWGTAISKLLCLNGHTVTLWSWKQEESDAIRTHKENKEFLPGVPLPDGILYTADLEKAAKAEFIVLATPSSVLPQTVENLAEHVAEDTILVNLTKGLCAKTNRRFSEVIRASLPKNPIVVVTGPSHAEEVGKGIPTTVVAASENQAAAETVQDVFMNTAFRVYTTTDVVGAELGGALKNVIALCAGIMDGLGFGDNTKAALMTRGLAEMSRLGIAMGANPATFAGLSGIGDLIVTCTSMHSRNRRAGILIGQGKSVQDALREVHMVVEGVYATESAYRLARSHGVDMPIVSAAYRVLFENSSPAKEVLSLMQREKKMEAEML